METLLGGRDLTITRLDGSTETVKVRQLPIRRFEALRATLADEPARVALYTGQPPPWADLLTPESFEAIIVEGDRLNADFFGRWLQRQMQWQDLLAPGLREQLVQAAMTSPGASPNSPLKPA